MIQFRSTRVLAAALCFALPALAQDGERPQGRRAPSPVKAEMENLEEAIEKIGEYLKKPEGDAPLAQVEIALESLQAAKKHAPRSAQRQPEEKRDEFVRAYRVAINKTMRSVLDLEDALVLGDHEAAAKALAALEASEKENHRIYKPRRQRRGGGDGDQSGEGGEGGRGGREGRGGGDV
ncbi:MAG: hypothetical protein KDE27_28635 [Planctomycetes bacterium]|nr:hypothetical protein [Planctomycetota bacterium]